MPRRLAQQRMTLNDLEWLFHASRPISAVAELLVYSTSLFQMQLGTSNVTGRHRGPKQKHRHDNLVPAVTHTFAYWTSPVSVTPTYFSRRVWYCTISLCMCMLCTYSTCYVGYFCVKFCFWRALHC